MECVVEAVAAYLNISPDAVKPLNFYVNGQKTPYGQPLRYFRFTPHHHRAGRLIQWPRITKERCGLVW